jgi:hypothetical protein
MSARRNHPLSGGPYRPVKSLNTAWVASPVIPESPKAFDGFPWNPAWVHEETNSEKAQRLGSRSKRRSSCVFKRCLKNMFSAFHDFDLAVTQVSDMVTFYSF